MLAAAETILQHIPKLAPIVVAMDFRVAVPSWGVGAGGTRFGRFGIPGEPRTIYERPATAFVADFIGSLNAVDFRVDEIVGGYAVMRLGEGERIVVPVASDARNGDVLRVAVRPERIRIGAAAPEHGSSVEGRVVEIVYLGMLTQFHIETVAGRIVSHRLADEPHTSLARDSQVTLSWAPEHTSVLGD